MISPDIAKLIKLPVFNKSKLILNFELLVLDFEIVKWFVENGVVPTKTRRYGYKVKFKSTEQSDMFFNTFPDLKYTTHG